MVLMGQEVIKTDGVETGLNPTRRVSKVRNSWRRVELTAEDWLLLRYCNEQRFLSYEQACRIYGTKSWHKYPTDPIDKRLRKLVHFGFIRRAQVYTESHAVVLLGREGHAALVQANRHRGLGYLDDVDLRTFPHDRMMTDLRLHRAVAQLRGEWRSERILRRLTGAKAVPDAAFISRATRRWIALELEQTRKSVERYRRILARYLRRPYQIILYILRDATQLRWWLRHAIPRLEGWLQWGTDEPPTPRLRLVLLDELTTLGGAAPVYAKLPHAAAMKLSMSEV